MRAVSRSRGAFVLQRFAAHRWASWVVLGVWIVFGYGALSHGGLGSGDLRQVSVLTILGAALLAATVRELSPRRADVKPSSVVSELELGLLLVTGVFVLLALTGGQRSFLYPLVYAVVSFLMVVHARAAVPIVLLLAVAGLELALVANTSAPERFARAGYHLTFVAFFAAGNLLVLRSLVARLRSSHARQVQDALGRMRQEARDFRLIASALPLQSRSHRRDDEELRMVHGAVESIHEQLFHTLDLLGSSLGLHTCALLWCEAPDAAGGRAIPRLCVKEMATHSELGIDSAQLPSAGILTSVLTDPKPLRLHSLAGRRVPPYYRGPERITDLCAVPLLDGAALRGILVADRIDDRAFTSEDEAVLAKAAGQIARVIEHERVFTAVERGKYEQEQFYRASELLNEALTLEQVCEKTFAAVRAIVPYDLAAITTIDAHQIVHSILAVDASGTAEGEWTTVAERLRGLQFGEPTSLVSMAVKNRHYMPAFGDLLDSDTLVFTSQTRLRAAHSVLVLPLCRGDEVLGAITLASSRPHQFSAASREMLRVISHQVGVSLQNALLYQSMEERATTDGLTGLTNHRAFQERLGHLHALAERTDQKYAIILTDIDHFKGINDTYGHPIGDQVLKRVAAIFMRAARKVDIVARYGGEEFVLVLPDTDGAGAESFANRLREEIAAHIMTSDNGNFKVTISMGVSEFPGDGKDRLGLIEKADQALYHCKERGRNRVCRVSAVA